MKITLSRNEVKLIEKVVVVLGTEKETHEELQKMLLTGEAVELEDGSLQLNTSEEVIEVLCNVARKVIPVVMTFATTIKNMFGDIVSEFGKLDRYFVSCQRVHFDSEHNETYRITSSGKLVVAEGHEMSDSDFGSALMAYNKAIEDFSVKYKNTEMYKSLLMAREEVQEELNKRGLTVVGDDRFFSVFKHNIKVASVESH